MSQSLSDFPCWYVIRTKPKQEARVKKNLEAWNVRTLAPALKEAFCNRFTGEASCRIKPLFPQYIFARFKASELFHKIRYARGVHSVVGFGNTLIPVSDDIIAIIRSRIGEDGLVRIGEPFSPGDEVRIDHGPFTNFTGIFERQMKDDDRVQILLHTISYQLHVIVERDQIRRVS